MEAIEPIQFGSDVLSPEPPVDGAARDMAFRLIRGGSLLQENLVGVAPLETVSGVPVPTQKCYRNVSTWGNLQPHCHNSNPPMDGARRVKKLQRRRSGLDEFG